MVVLDLYKISKDNPDKKVVAIIDGNEVPLCRQIYVEDEISYFFPENKENDDYQTNGDGMIMSIENEASDECWQSERLDEQNGYLGITMSISSLPCDKEDGAKYYDVEDIVVKEDKICIICA